MPPNDVLPEALPHAFYFLRVILIFRPRHERFFIFADISPILRPHLLTILFHILVFADIFTIFTCHAAFSLFFHPFVRSSFSLYSAAACLILPIIFRRGSSFLSTLAFDRPLLIPLRHADIVVASARCRAVRFSFVEIFLHAFFRADIVDFDSLMPPRHARPLHH